MERYGWIALHPLLDVRCMTQELVRDGTGPTVEPFGHNP